MMMVNYAMGEPCLRHLEEIDSKYFSTMRPPVKINGERQIGETIWKKSLIAQSYMNPRTNEIYEYGIFRADCLPATVIFPITDDFNVIAIRQFRHAADEFVLELPGGTPEKETAKENAIRELIQETGYWGRQIEHLTEKPIYFDPASLTVQFDPYLFHGCL